MKGPDLSRNQVESLLETPFLRVADLHYAEGKHYYVATRRPLDHLVAVRCEEDFRAMQPDAVTCVVILRTPGDEPRLLLMREYRYPAGRFLLSPPAGLMDPEDLAAPQPPLSTALREIREETGLSASPTRLEVINPLLFSSPGMTDESNALVLAVYDLPDLSQLTQTGAVGTECFDGFRLLTRKQAVETLRQGRDEEEHFYSIFTWAALTWFVSGLWDSPATAAEA